MSNYKESLIERIKERQWDHGKFPAVYVDDVDEIIRQHQSDHIGGADKMISSEISDVILAINKNYLSAIVKESETIPGHYYMPFRKGEIYHINRLAEIVASTREPVSVSLEKCAKAACSAQCDTGLPECCDWKDFLPEAKAVLDAAGVPYVS